MTIFTKTFYVEDTHSAKHWGSGSLNVLATPALVAFMENTAFDYVQAQLNQEQTTVGSAIAIEHLAPTKVGQVIRVDITNVTKNGKVYQFKLEAYDNDKLIGKSTHTRVVIIIEKFLMKIV